MTCQLKRLMVAALKDREDSEEPPKCIPLFSHPSPEGLNEFVTKSTLRLFRILELPDAFLEDDPSEWINHEEPRHESHGTTTRGARQSANL